MNHGCISGAGRWHDGAMVVPDISLDCVVFNAGPDAGRFFDVAGITHRKGPLPILHFQDGLPIRDHQIIGNVNPIAPGTAPAGIPRIGHGVGVHP